MTVLGGILLGLVVTWRLGGVALRLAGALSMLAGLSALAVPSLAGGESQLVAVALVLLGLPAWLAGHWHFAWRNHFYKSPLAERMLGRLFPARLDPRLSWQRHAQRRRLGRDPGR